MSSTAAPLQGERDARFAFLAGLLDDAGLFPPARLTMPDAVARHRGDRERRGWLVSRFLCPAATLDELAAHLRPDDDWRLGVVCDGTVEAGAAAAAAVGAKLEGVVVAGIEARAAGSDVEAGVRLICDEVARSLAPGVVVFAEVPVDPSAIAAVSAVRASAAAQWPQRSVAAKIRCGGLTAEAFPSVDDVAGVLVEAVGRSVPLKATAGLHHPVRHRDPDTGAMMHGFYNLVGAAVLLSAQRVKDDHADEVVGEEDPEAFSLTAEGFSWRGRQVDPHGVALARREVFTGYGSCSIDEPVEDLVVLGVLPEGS